MRQRAWVRYAGFLFLIGLALLTSVTSALAVCHDNDHDGYGNGCALGPDCNDSNAAVHPGATEVCNGIDDDCDGLIDEGLGFRSCGVGICQHVIANCAGGIVPNCDAFSGARAETCNGLDDDCDGKVDNLTSTDADGDGASPPCDCNDGDPTIHKGAIDICDDGIDQDCDGNVDNMKSDGAQSYCVSLEPEGDLVIDGASAFVVKAFHPSGVDHVTIGDEFNGGDTLFCSGTTYCTGTAYQTRQYRGAGTMSATLYKSGQPYGILVGTVTQPFQFTCDKPYCRPDPIFGDFATWLRQKGVPEGVIGKSFEYTKVPFQEDLIRPLLHQRPKPLTPGVTVQLVDVVANDGGSTNRPLASGTCRIAETPPNCQADPNWPAFCPSAVPADVSFLQAKLRQTFGINLTLSYTRRCTNYASEIGTPDCTTYPGVCRYPPVINFVNSLNLPPNSIVHFANSFLNGNAVDSGSLTGEGSVTPIAMVGWEPDTSGGLGVFSHEWGHTWGLVHSFYVTYPAYRELTPDGIMDNTYLGHNNAGDLLSPLERYVLEPTPPGNYTDAATWGTAYDTAVLDSEIPSGAVDPAIALPANYYSYDPNVPSHNFDLTLSNKGTAKLGYVSLRAYDGDLTGRMIDEQFVNLDRGETSTYRFSIPPTTPWGLININHGKVYFVLDQTDVITAAAGDVTTNNAVTAYLPACTDADGDGYTPECIQCYNVNCPYYDCDDTHALAKPGGIEGPYGSGTCSDSIDNNCANGYDLLDPICHATPDVVTASGESLTQGTKTGLLSDTYTGNGVYESLTEAGSGTRLIYTWTFTNVQAGTSNDLIYRAYRPTTAESENFKFSYFNGTSYVDIPNAIIDNPAPEQTDRVIRFPAAVSGTVLVRITDVTKNGNTADTAKIDYLVIRTNH